MLLPRTPPAVLLLVSTSLLAAPPAASAAPPAYLVRDVATGGQVPYIPAVREHIEFVHYDGRLYFAAEDGVHGRELWATDGTTAGTELVADVCPGYCFGWAEHLTAMGGRLYFLADDGAHGEELWSSDGTAAGTALVADLVPGIGSSRPAWLTAVGDRLYFTALDPQHGRELWVSDGTAQGTVRVADLAAGETSSAPDRLAPVAGGLFFTADDGAHGREPWFTDGTATQLLADLLPGASGSLDKFQAISLASLSRDWSPLPGRVVFAARDDLHGTQLWTSDGTPGGTALLADLSGEGPTGSASPRGLFEMDGRVYFQATTPAEGTELWVTDGIADTHLVTEVVPGNGHSFVRILGAAGGWLYLAAQTPAAGSELWRSDGTAANTEMVADAVPGPVGSLSEGLFLDGVAVGTRFLYTASSPDSGLEPWITDGTAAGTHLLRDVYPGNFGSSLWIGLPYTPAALGDQAVFIAYEPSAFVEPWITDGTEAGTRLLADVDRQVSTLLPCFFFHCSSLGEAGGKLYGAFFDATHGVEPWVSRGTAGTTELLGNLEPATSFGFGLASDPGGWVAAGETVLFTIFGWDWELAQLWRSDGTPAGTWALAAGGGPHELTSALGTAYFVAGTDDEGYELWTSDGTQAGTRMVADVHPGPDGSALRELAEGAGKLVFSATDGVSGTEPWSSDGTAEGTSRIADLAPGASSSSPCSFTPSEDRFFFSADLPGTGRELWVSDGTESGTRLVLDLLPGPEPGLRSVEVPHLHRSTEIAAGEGGAYFLGDDGIHGIEPWWSDGSETGTKLLGDLRPGPLSSSPRYLVDVAGRGYFSADDGIHGRELWTSDSTETGTRLVTDLAGGAGSSLPQWLTPVDDLLYFAAHRPDVGMELWRTDSTEAGTELVADVFPGPEPSTPEFLTVAGRRLFFTANDGEHGFEPWALLLPGRLPRLSLHVDGSFLPGGVVQLTAVLLNPPPVAMPDGDGDELVLPLPPELQYLDGEATSGELGFQDPAGAAAAGQRTAAAATIGGGTLTWNGALAAGGAVTVTARARILPGVPPGTVVTLAGEGWLDSDEDGTSDFRFPGDDPGQPGDEDPATVVVAPQVLDVPALAPVGLALLAAVLAAAGPWVLRRRHRGALLVLLALLAVSLSPATAAEPPPSLVEDLTTQSRLQQRLQLHWSEYTEWQSRLYFGFDDGIHGRELWETDGTEAGTRLVIDLCPGHCPGWVTYMAATDGGLYFTGDDGSSGRELWFTDTTPGGTRIVLDAVPGLGRSSPQDLTVLGDRVLYSATDPAHGRELWISDGTAAGTHRLDLWDGEGGSEPDRLVPLPSGVFFTAYDGAHGREPWFSDGTPAGTSRLADLRAGDEDSVPANNLSPLGAFRTAVRFGASVVFAADDGIHGSQTWITDGTSVQLLADLQPVGGYDPLGYTELDGRLFFTPWRGPSRELWVTSSGGTEQVPGVENATILGAAGGWLYFAMHSPGTGTELWRTQGPETGAELVADTHPGPEDGMVWSQYLGAFPVGEQVVFFADDGTSGMEPWITDGTPAGSGLLRDVNAGPDWSYPFGITLIVPHGLGGQLLVFAQDETGFDPWLTDGTPAGTRRLRDVDTQASSLSQVIWFHIVPRVASGSRLFALWQDDEHGAEPWVSRGTPGTTFMLADLEPSSEPGAGSFAQDFVPWEDGTLFTAHVGGIRSLWRTGGVAGDPAKLIDLEMAGLTPALGAAFFSGDGAEGYELWRTDGTAAGTTLVTDLRPGPDDSSPRHLTELGGRLWFSAEDDAAGRELWTSDGTAVGTVLAADLVPGTGSSHPQTLTSVESLLCFTAETPAEGRELWCSDGEDELTEPVLDLNPGPGAAFEDEREVPAGSNLVEIAGAPGGMFLVADDGVHGSEPWWSDGSEGGTALLRDVRAGILSSEPSWLTVFAGRAFFAADDGVRGRELWTSDGTGPGTEMVLDLVPGAGSSLPQWLTPVDGLLYFAAHRPDVGMELWRTDGTEAGTELVADVYPGPEPSTPEFLTVAGRRLFFTANDGEHGFEPWALLLPGRLPRLSLHVDGSFLPGGVVQLTAVLLNPPPVAMPDGDGDELVLPLPPGLQYLAGEATSGELAFQAPAGAAAAGQRAAAAATIGGGTLSWNGALAAGGSVTVTARARILPGVLPGTVLTLAGEGWLDSDEDGTSDFRFSGDDPGRPGDEDPATVVVAPQVLDVPALDAAGLAALALLLAAVALRRLAG